MSVVPLGAPEAAITAYKAAGGVVEYVLVLVQGERQENERHRLAVVAGVREIARRWDEWVERRITETGSARNQFRRIDVAPSGARGRLIDVNTFVGRAYDHDANRVVSLWVNSPGGAGSKSGAGDYLTDGYAEAFSDPPYTLQADLDRVNAWFQSINRNLFGGLSDALRISQWETDWSNWFDDGHEWWGSFCWTVEAPGSELIAVIAASSTD